MLTPKTVRSLHWAEGLEADRLTHVIRAAKAGRCRQLTVSSSVVTQWMAHNCSASSNVRSTRIHCKLVRRLYPAPGGVPPKRACSSVSMTVFRDVCKMAAVNHLRVYLPAAPFATASPSRQRCKSCARRTPPIAAFALTLW